MTGLVIGINPLISWIRRNIMELKEVIFIMIALTTVVSGWLVVSLKNIIHSAFALLVTFFGVGGLFVYVGADFLAATQILIYIGGVMILVLFAIMLSEGVYNISLFHRARVLPALLVLGALPYILFRVIMEASWHVRSGAGGEEVMGGEHNPNHRRTSARRIPPPVRGDFSTASFSPGRVGGPHSQGGGEEEGKGRMNIISLQSYLIISALLFSFGLFAIISRKNAISVLLGFELIMNAAGLNFAAFSHFSDSVIHGQVFTIFIIALAAAESAVILALIISVYQKMDTVQIDEIDSLKG